VSGAGVWQYLYEKLQFERSSAIAQRREAVPVSLARLWEGLCEAARLQAARAATYELQTLHVRGVFEAVCKDGRIEQTLAF